ncbi:MAG: L-glutamate gamma-semialdehyde dehydrogenase [Elusimicrobiales bacterium]|nr:L-glutamate gamma-semialdehyde dehydrogenase [Elusimicrobiales bacterium]
MTLKFPAERPVNEPNLSYAPGSPERAAIRAKLDELKASPTEVPLFIGGAEVRTGRTALIRAPHDHKLELGRYHRATAAEVDSAIDAAVVARRSWGSLHWRERAGVFLRAADLLAGPWRQALTAATMLCASKSVQQAEADTAELADLFRFNAWYAGRLWEEQPSQAAGERNRLGYRPLENFVYAVTPFNFTSIAGNLPAAPALMGNPVVWKPASNAMLPAHYIMSLLREAGLPDGVINMVSGPAGEIGNRAIESEHFAGLNFTGSTPVFNGMWSAIVRNLFAYKCYPRIVGETGGKCFIFAHASCDPEALKTAIIRGAFEHQGQKCASASRAYIPKPLWESIKGDLAAAIDGIKMGPPEDFSCFMNAVIDKMGYDNIKGYIDQAKKSPSAKILAGGQCDERQGYFIRPTLIETSDSMFKTMQEEIFGPVLTVYPYEEKDFARTLEICDSTSPYALTGSLFARDEAVIAEASKALENAAGNFYVNDKPTGAVMDRQPFGGGRASGTNDKVGWYHSLLRWTSVRTVKENLSPPTDYRYPCMSEE